MSKNRLTVVLSDAAELPAPAAPANRERAREPDVQLAAMVPQSVKRAVRRRAEEEGTTVRSILLHALKLAGIAEVDDAEIADRRVAAGALRSGIWRNQRR
ncbi:hypothetical protein [Azospirillum sp. TSO22-1]|uniref:hypothetical protein n=1 Tax=Azospirillum sp. TSO22-1 TaxID=716789 RepID=UPI000D613DF2|nr:hypothetical protein [Azospirillum sp. TSO22-1]PWC32179.1 hypothetical protein TSO221_31155 [Azospirillum sp. TSO22-1]